jgi:ABC-2 type transport system ATP-binding protein
VFFSTHITSDLEKCADHIVYIREGRIVLADTREQFHEKLGIAGETLEETMLRLEKEARHEKTAV